MSFFKKMVDKLEDVVSSDDKKKNNEEKHVGAHESYGSNQYPPGGPQGQYGQPPAPYGHQQPLGSSVGPQLPPGWVAQWDQNSQRYYYLEQATGRTQWNPPLAGPPIGSHGYTGQGQYGAPGGSGGYYSQQYNQYTDSHGGKHKEVYEKKEKSGKGGVMAGAAGGLAVGAVGGALVGHAMGDDSDDEHKAQTAYQQPTYVQQTSYYQEGAPPPVAPPPGSDHHSVSSSDREDLNEAREEYENASASDKESAREEYEEQYEETYGSD